MMKRSEGMKKSQDYKRTIDQIKSETSKLRDQLSVDTLHSTNLATSSQIARLQDQGDAFDRKIEIEKKRKEELEAEIAEVQAKIFSQRKEMGGASGAKETNEGLSRKIRGLENKLDKALQKYNESVAHNKSLRTKIDALRREKIVCDKIYRKLEEELEEKKADLARLINKKETAVKAKSNADEEMKKLKRQAEEEQAEFENEWKELGRLIEEDKKINDFIKPRDSMMTSQEQPALEGPDEVLALTDESKKKTSIFEIMEKVQMYDEAFAKINEATGITEIDELVKTFVDSEKQNYSLFNYVNELSNEMDKLKQQIHETKEEINTFKGQGVTTDNQRKKIMHELEERLERTEIRAELYEKNYEETMKTINSLKIGIQNIFERIGCETEGLGVTEVTETNMMQFLGVIEQRTNEILQMYSSIQAPAEPAHISSRQPGTTQPLEQIKIDPLDIDDYAAEDEEAEDNMNAAPLSKEKIREYALKKVKKHLEKNHRKK